MGFFGNMRSINRIYALLREIEPLMVSLTEMSQHNTSDRQLTLALANKMCKLKNELTDVVRNAGNTVRCADFQFMGGKYRIDDIIAAISEITTTVIYS